MANNEWGTPPEYIESARTVMGSIDFDPASNDVAQKIVQAKSYCTIAKPDQAFLLPWLGNVFLNPPYGVGCAKPFMDRLIEELFYCSTEQAIVLTNNVTDTDWFSDTAGKFAAAYCFPSKRIQFVAPQGTKKSSNSKGQVFSYFGDNVAGFAAEFKQYGLVVLPFRDHYPRTQ